MRWQNMSTELENCHQKATTKTNAIHKTRATARRTAMQRHKKEQIFNQIRCKSQQMCHKTNANEKREHRRCRVLQCYKKGLHEQLK